MGKQVWIAALLLFICTTSINASTVQLSVSGQVGLTFPLVEGGAGGDFSVSILLDSATADSDLQDVDRGTYASSLGLGVLIYEGVTYTEIGGPNSIIVWNNNSVFGFGLDRFVYNGFFESDSGVIIDLGLQFVDTSNSVFNDDSHPDSLDLDQFDSFDVADPFNGTYAALFFLDPAFDSVFGPISFAQLRPVPIPAAMWLFVSGIGLLCGVSRRMHLEG